MFTIQILDERGRTIRLYVVILYNQVSHRKRSAHRIFRAIFKHENQKFDIEHILPHSYGDMYNSVNVFPQIQSLKR